MNSTENQEIKRKFVDREVIYCVSYLISELSKLQEHLDYQDQEALWNLQSTPDYESTVDYYDGIHVMHSKYLDGYVWVNRSLNVISDPFDTKYEAYKDCCEENNIDYDYFEAYEHWVVSKYLGDKLKDKGEMVDDFFGMTVWGRCTSGQAILLDGVISEICNDMEILKGQKYEWEV